MSAPEKIGFQYLRFEWNHWLHEFFCSAQSNNLALHFHKISERFAHIYHNSWNALLKVLIVVAICLKKKKSLLSSCIMDEENEFEFSYIYMNYLWKLWIELTSDWGQSQLLWHPTSMQLHYSFSDFTYATCDFMSRCQTTDYEHE